MSNNFTNNSALSRESLSLDPSYHACSATKTIYHLEHFCFEDIKLILSMRIQKRCTDRWPVSVWYMRLAHAYFFRAWPNLGRYKLYQEFFHNIVLRDEKYYLTHIMKSGEKR